MSLETFPDFLRLHEIFSDFIHMRLGIDASNIRDGGGVTYLSELLSSAEPAAHGFANVVLWAGKRTMAEMPERSWLERSHVPALDRSLPVRLYWQQRKLPALARRHCDVLFVPGGNSGGQFKPYITVSHNLLPFESDELFRYGVSGLTAKFLLLRAAQKRSFERASGLIFLSDYARSVIEKVAALESAKPIIPHGIHEKFFMPPRHARTIEECSERYPFKVLYVSKIEPYKHQWQVVEATAMLRNNGLPIELDLIGPATHDGAARRLRKTIERVDPQRRFIHIREEIPHDELPAHYHDADLFVFASSCENLPNILLEAMAAGLPIACSNRGPMPEVLKDAGVYFDPEKPAQIAGSIITLVENTVMRSRHARAAYRYAQRYSWKQCAADTFSYLTEITHRSRTAAPAAHREFAGDTLP
jgi:glycosyltransferase involved in cell wall biosynthesis